MELENPYYITEVDRKKNSIYCYHTLMGERFIRNHSHLKGQFIYTEGGMVHIQTTTKIHFLPARHYMWIPPHVEHAIYPSSPDVLMRNLYFPVADTDPEFYYREGVYPVNDMLLQLLLFTRHWKGDIKRTNKTQYPIVEAFKVLLPQISLKPLVLTLPKPKDPRLENLIVYLHERLDQNLLLSDIARDFGLSERSLHRLFKKDLDMSFIHYFTLLRVSKAIEYLVEQRYTISEIANKVGYNSVPTFSNTFQKITGNRPSEYNKGNSIFM
tara:strand:- start:295 stop:1101 length:807 start_codon:yes stop_codon:yes gene_type:complete